MSAVYYNSLKNRIISLCLLFVLLFAAGCGMTGESPAAPPSTAPTEPAEVTVTEAPIEEPAETAVPEPAPTAEPVPRPLSADIPVGGFADSFYCAETGDYMDYWLFVPNNATEDMPLIVYLHGDGQVNRPDTLPESGIVQQMWINYDRDFPFILLVPCTRIESWWANGVSTTLKTLIDIIVLDYAIDPERVAITGHSRGAIGVWHMIDLYGDYFSCAVPVSLGSDAVIVPESYVNVPLRGYIGGINDYYVYGSNMERNIGFINDAGGDASLTVYWDKSHIEMADAAYTAELFEWMAEQGLQKQILHDIISVQLY